MANSKRPVHDLICFHCQQSAEKYLKGLAHEYGLKPPKIHDLEDLLELLLPHDATLRRLRRTLMSLTPYGVEYRYPGDRATKRQAQSAIRGAGRVRKEIRVRLGLRS